MRFYEIESEEVRKWKIFLFQNPAPPNMQPAANA